MEPLKKIMDMIKESVNGKEKRKLVENAVVVIILGIIIIITGQVLFGKSGKGGDGSAGSGQVAQEQEAVSVLSSQDEKYQLQKKVEEILSQIDGAGRVNVMITYVSGKEVVPAYNSKTGSSETQEKDSNGGTRSIKETDAENSVAYEETQGGVKKPLILKEISPQVKGVVVVADGASNIQVKDRLCKAVQVLLDVPVYKIQVLERKK